jgi:hypothetical protein
LCDWLCHCQQNNLAAKNRGREQVKVKVECFTTRLCFTCQQIATTLGDKRRQLAANVHALLRQMATNPLLRFAVVCCAYAA